MEQIILEDFPVWGMALIILGLTLLFNWLGFAYRKRQMKDHSFIEPSGLNILESSLMGLTALLLGFTFSMVATKFENRRQVIVTEANHIGTAILRCDLYPDSVKTLMRADFRKYVEARIASYEAMENDEKIDAALDTTFFYSSRIWERVAALSQDPANFVRSGQMIPALNNMIDIVTVRVTDRHARVPRLILGILMAFCFLSAFLSGYGNKSQRRNRVLVGAFAFMTTVALFLILELDRPKQGLINVGSSEKAIENLRQMLIDR